MIQIYHIFCETIWKIEPVLVSKHISLASLALDIWKLCENPRIIRSLYLPINLSDYNVIRSMYYGGRVLPTIAKYDSALWKYVNNQEDDFYDMDTGLSYWTFAQCKELLQKLVEDKEGEDELKDVDVVSLYPSVMEQQLYPVGKYYWKILENEAEKKMQAKEMEDTIKAGKKTILAQDYDQEYDENFEFTIENNAYNNLKMLMFRRCYCVDMEAHPHMKIAFVLRRNSSDDRPEQTLAPLQNHWITGVELFEALRVGYFLKRIHSFITWEELAPVFKIYINKIFKIKEENKKDKTSAMYMVAKLLMNALSGKFGQKIVSDVITLLNSLPRNPARFFNHLHSISYEVIEKLSYGEDHATVIGYLFSGMKKEQDIDIQYPTHLSVFILAHSRRKMSKMLRHVNGYYDEQHTFFYTDTDSLLIRKSTFDLLKKKFIGSGLGKLEDEFPNDIILCGRFMAPKTYVLCLLKEDKESKKAKIYYKVRCKGIPHRGDVFCKHDYENDDLQSWGEVEIAINKPVEDLKTHFYVIHHKTDRTIPEQTIPFIGITACDQVLSGNYLVSVHFGSILKGKDKDNRFIMKTQWIHRRLGLQNWWDQDYCTRIKQDPEGYKMTLCKGYPEPHVNTTDSHLIILPNSTDDILSTINMTSFPWMDEMLPINPPTSPINVVDNNNDNDGFMDVDI